MKLYTINGNYPDQHFSFTVSAEDLGLSPTAHSHGISSVTGLNQALSSKADVDHDHECVSTIFNTTPSEEETSVSITVQSSSGNAASCTVSSQDITINYESAQTGNVIGITETNPESDNLLVQLFIGKLTKIDSNDNNATFLSMEDNVNA